jgi:UDP-N-acetylglucosamine--N-acetylmuramyl-(pentapeptide) pyrophosphoryl-undecaprenol N-acetylglucosamine transferase
MNIIDFFSSPIGLGHVTRDIAIVNNFQNITTNFVSGSGAAKILENLDFNIHDRYTPPSFVIKNGSLQNPAKWLWNYYQYYKDCKNIAKEIIQKDEPNLVISDEDFASISIAQEKNIPTVLITDVLETRFTNGIASLIEKKMNKSMQKMIEKCDIVIIPENGNNYDNIKYVGPIVRQTNFSRDELRQKFSFKDKTIVISIGGTNAGEFLIEKAIEAILKINQGFEIVLVSGPAVNKKFENVRNLGFVDNLHEIIFAADLIISLAGKSTIDEAKVYGTPSIFIPIKDHFEQEDNAREEGFDYEDIERLDELILEKIEQKKNQIISNGSIEASKIIKNLMKN